MDKINFIPTTGSTDPLNDSGNRRYWVIRGFPERDAAQSAAEQGIYRKYDVKRADGSSAPGGKHHDCEYFVLDLTHDVHAPAAMIAYARSAAGTHPQLAADIISRFDAGDTADAATFNGQLNAAPALLALSALRLIVADDAHASTFQSLGQYRTAVLSAIDGARSNVAAYASQAVALGVIHEVTEALRAALAAFPKSAAQACIERALSILQGQASSPASGSDFAVNSQQALVLDEARISEADIERLKASFTDRQFHDIGSLETGENHHD